MRIKDIHSDHDTNIGILLYIKNNVSIDYEISNIKSGKDTDIVIHEYFQTLLAIKGF